MTYPLLEAAPKDHNSPEFLKFLRDNNPVVYDFDKWLVIANCKYDKPERRWYTAFHTGEVNSHLDMCFLADRYGHLEWKKKATKNQTVKRFHIHMYEPD